MGVLNKAVLATIFMLASLSAQAGHYDGIKEFKVQSNRAGDCSASAGNVKIENGKISGNLLISGLTLRINGKVSEDGSFKGKVGIGVATFIGRFSGNSGTGTWKGRLGCKGKIFIQ